MAMIFPGMDPYLEDPASWVGVHNSLIVYIRDLLQPKLRPRYLASMEERVYVEHRARDFRPDAVVKQPRPARRADPGLATLEPEADPAVEVWSPVEEVREPFLTVLDLRNGQQLVAVIEIISPSNKAPGPGRESYLAKQAEILAGGVHLVEIDLLRAGRHVLAVPEHRARETPYHYLVSVNRAEGDRSLYHIYPRTVRDRLPRFEIPLSGDDPAVVLDLQAALVRAYDGGGYDEAIDYGNPCVPPLSVDDQAWATDLIGEAMR